MRLITLLASLSCLALRQTVHVASRVSQVIASPGFLRCGLPIWPVALPGIVGWVPIAQQGGIMTLTTFRPTSDVSGFGTPHGHWVSHADLRIPLWRRAGATVAVRARRPPRLVASSGVHGFVHWLLLSASVIRLSIAYDDLAYDAVVVRFRCALFSSSSGSP